MRRGKKLLALAIGGALALAIAACGNDDEAADTGGGDDSAVKVALVMSGSINDGGWNQGAHSGLATLTAQGFETKFSENVQQADISSALEGYAKDGFDLVIGHGFEFGSAVSELAPRYPETSFFATTFTPDAGVALPSNLAFVDVQYYKVSYATGVLAALMSEAGTVGLVGGGDNPTQATMIKAFEAGAASVNGTKALSVLTGDYDDPQKGREAALAMIGQGADVIGHIANTTGLGALQAAVAEGVQVLGFYDDQLTVAPELMGTSFRINLGAMVAYLGEALRDGTYPGGTEWAPEMSFMWAPVAGDADHNASVVPDDVWATFLDTYAKINNGEISVPTS